jgi:hypothetical protein
LKNTENGSFPGFYLRWNHNKRNAVYSKVLLESSYGDDTYDGTDQAGTIPTTFQMVSSTFSVGNGI